MITTTSYEYRLCFTHAASKDITTQLVEDVLTNKEMFDELFMGYLNDIQVKQLSATNSMRFLANTLKNELMSN